MNILLVATNSYAGMGSYASEIINSFSDEANVFGFVVEDDARNFSHNLSEQIKSRTKIVHLRTDWLYKVTSLFFSPCGVVKQLDSFCKEKKIDVVHFLTSDIPYMRKIISMSRCYSVFFTVHDLHPHETHLTFIKKWRYNLLYKKLERIRLSVSNLITNSEAQAAELRAFYPNKNILYHEFPSLVNKTIISGKQKPAELQGEDNYVLFFGRVELYKGVDLAYKAFAEHKQLSGYKLVIAGSGNLYFPQSNPKPENIIVINRYINDEEVAWLYNHAAITLYPYISATQSGVLSLSCYFGKPIVASNVPFFQTVCRNNIGVNFIAGDIEDMVSKICDVLASDMDAISQTQRDYYDTNYSKQGIKKSLLAIYEESK